MRAVRQIAALLFIIALPVALVTTNIRIVLNEPRVYTYATDHYHTTETTRISRHELLRASGELRDYFNSDQKNVSIRAIRGNESVVLFNERETSHLRDVKSVFQASFRVQEGAIIFIMAYIVMVFLWAREGSLRRLAREVFISGVASLAALAAVGLVALFGFDAFWNRFHVILFPSGNWEFDPRTDRLIQMFPDDFWRDVTLWIALGTLVELLLLSIGAGAVLRMTRERRVRTVKISGELPAGEAAEA